MQKRILVQGLDVSTFGFVCMSLNASYTSILPKSEALQRIIGKQS